MFGWIFNTVTYAWQSRKKVFTGGPSVVREGPDPRSARLSHSVGFGWTTTQLFNFFPAPESFHDADEVVAVRHIEFNRTRDASHVQVHSFSLTSKRLPSVPDTPSQQPLVLPGWCCCCLLRSCVVPIWSSRCCPASSAHTWARLRLRSPDGGQWSSSALDAEKVIQCSGCGVCEGCDVVGCDHAPQAGVAQGV